MTAEQVDPAAGHPSCLPAADAAETAAKSGSESGSSAPAKTGAKKTSEADADADGQVSQADILLSASLGKPRAPMVRARSERAYILALWPWRETSVIAELLTARHGRVAVTVKGAKRPGGKFRGLINAFTPLLVNFSGSGEVKNLTDAKWLGGLPAIAPEALVSAFYVNELVMRLTVREDPCEELFGAYEDVLGALASEKGLGLQRALRIFEVKLLRVLGWGQSAKEEELARDDLFWIVRNGELKSVDALASGEAGVPADVARAIVSCRFDNAADIRGSRDVLREIIGYYVGDRGLNTRSTMARWAGFSP